MQEFTDFLEEELVFVDLATTDVGGFLKSQVHLLVDKMYVIVSSTREVVVSRDSKTTHTVEGK